MPEMQQRTPGRGPSDAALRRSITASRVEGDPHIPASIPPWVHVNDNGEKPPFPQPAAPIVPNTRHYRPPHDHFKRGRKWDHERSAEAPLLSEPIASSQARWRQFMDSGPNYPQETDGAYVRYGDRSADGSRIVSQQWLEQNIPIAVRQWDPRDVLDPEAEGRMPTGFKGIMYRGKWLISPERQERTVRLYWRLLLKNAFVPLGLRLTVLAFSAAGLGIASTIYKSVEHVNSDPSATNQCATRASTYMGIIVGAVAIPYIGYVTWDEYMSKPIGLRSVAAKTSLLLCDLIFIVFSASNVSLAFEAVADHSWACYDESQQVVGGVVQMIGETCPNNPNICYKQSAFSGVLVVSLVAWLLCFSLSVFRVVEKLRSE